MRSITRAKEWNLSWLREPRQKTFIYAFKGLVGPSLSLNSRQKYSRP